MDARLLFPNLYISAADLIEAQKKTGRDGVVLTIASVRLEELKTERGKDKKACVYFVEMEKRHRDGNGENKRLVLNKTNMKTIAKLYGYETNDWVGKRVMLFPSRCEAFGETVDCVRIRDQAPPEPTKKPQPAYAAAREPGDDEQ